MAVQYWPTPRCVVMIRMGEGDRATVDGTSVLVEVTIGEAVSFADEVDVDKILVVG